MILSYLVLFGSLFHAFHVLWPGGLLTGLARSDQGWGLEHFLRQARGCKDPLLRDQPHTLMEICLGDWRGGGVQRLIRAPTK